MGEIGGWDIPGLPEPGELFEALRQLSADGAGVTRAAYSQSETAALNYISSIAIDCGLDVAVDQAANLVVKLPHHSENLDTVVIGSHLDSVPQGGNYDGAAGVIAGLLCLARLKHENRKGQSNVQLLALRGEESPWFDTACLGSRALFGELKTDLPRRNRLTRRTLLEHFEDVGADVSAILEGQRLLPSSGIIGYYEIHIEQGPILLQRNVPAAIVSGIRGILRFPSIKCVGEEGHSGAVPRELRKDAVAAAVSLLHRMDEYWAEILARGQDLVITSGMLSTNHDFHSPSRIAGEVEFSFDARSLARASLDDCRAAFLAAMAAVEKERGVHFQAPIDYLTAPETMDFGMRRHLMSTANARGIPVIEIASGSGHDAMVFARNGVPSAMIFVRNEHGSHNPMEAMEMSDFLIATELLYQAIVLAR